MHARAVDGIAAPQLTTEMSKIKLSVGNLECHVVAQHSMQVVSRLPTLQCIPPSLDMLSQM